MGAENVQIDESENDDYFIPTNGDCFFKCLMKATQIRNEDTEQV